MKTDLGTPIHVTNEIGKLRKVLLHRPGSELEQLTPEYLDQLLFDDIPYLKAAQQEHDYFANLLRENGAEVVYLEDMTAETLAQSPEIKEQFVREFIIEAGTAARHYQKELHAILLDIADEKELVYKTMTGVGISELKDGARGPLVSMLARDTQFVLDPIPNLYFTRDPFATIGHGVSLNHMFSRTRNREVIYGRYILKYHPDYRSRVPLYYHCSYPFSIEGGDIINLSANVLAIGMSQRTTPEAIEMLAASVFQDEQSTIDTLLAIDIPNLRTYMHLDTVFTQIDRTVFTVHPGILNMLRIYKLVKKNGRGEFAVECVGNQLDCALRDALGVDDVTLIHCGGQDRIAAAREQWNDGANTLSVAPGVVAVYDRNNITNRVLREMGVTVLEIPSSELSRGRGGPRCMSMPLIRNDI